MLSKPRVSVIIPFSRFTQVQFVLKQLQRQTYPNDLMEIVLVGHKSSMVAGINVKAIETEPIFFPGRARNIGAHVAIGEYLLFLDDDCEPDPTWIEQNIAVLERVDVGAVGGKIAGKSKAFFARCVDFSRFGFYQTGKEREMVVCSASLGISKKLFEEVGGFNETLRSEEDMDFCFRLQSRGYKTLYHPGIKVLHDHRRVTLMSLMHYSYFHGRTSGLYVKRLYPGFSRRNRILTLVQQPALYLFAMIPLALGATLNILRLTIREYPMVVFYAPFIFASKLASHVGIWFWLLHNVPNQQTVEENRQDGKTKITTAS